MSEFRKVDPRIATETITAFLIIAQRPGIPRRELEMLADMSQSAALRHIKLMTKAGDPARLGPDKQGLDLVFTEADVLDPRVMRAYLTPKGARLRDRVARIMEGDDTNG